MSDKFPMLNVMSLSSFFCICVLPQVCGMMRCMHSFSKFLLYAFNLQTFLGDTVISLMNLEVELKPNCLISHTLHFSSVDVSACT